MLCHHRLIHWVDDARHSAIPQKEFIWSEDIPFSTRPPLSYRLPKISPTRLSRRLLVKPAQVQNHHSDLNPYHDMYLYQVIAVFLVSTLFDSLTQVEAKCCRWAYSTCPDGTKATPACCGYGKCHIDCCNCEGGKFTSFWHGDVMLGLSHGYVSTWLDIADVSQSPSSPTIAQCLLHVLEPPCTVEPSPIQPQRVQRRSVPCRPLQLLLALIRTTIDMRRCRCLLR